MRRIPSAGMTTERALTAIDSSGIVESTTCRASGTNMHRIVPVLIAVALTAPLAAQGQKIKVTTESVPVYVTVVDSDKRLVPDLTLDDFEVLDNQKPQQ